MIAAAFSLARAGDRSPRALLAELLRGESESVGVIEGEGSAPTARSGGARPRFASLEEATRATGPFAEAAPLATGDGLLVARAGRIDLEAKCGFTLSTAHGWLSTGLILRRRELW